MQQLRNRTDRPVIKAEAMPLFPTMPSIDSAILYIEGHLPIDDHNTLLSLLMVYHNSLLAEVRRGQFK